MIYDISPAISPRLKVWPGDTPLSRQVLREIRKGDNYTLSTLRATVHLGAHADAPSHAARGGAAIDRRELDYYLGRCQLVRTKVRRGASIRPEDVRDPVKAERVLFRTGTFPRPSAFNRDFASLSPGLIEFLHARGVRLVGIDTPSVDPFSSKDLPAHRALRRHGMANLEGLVLEEVPAGIYELIALPLKLVGFDASPVRAVLRTQGSNGG